MKKGGPCDKKRARPRFELKKSYYFNYYHIKRSSNCLYLSYILKRARDEARGEGQAYGNLRGGPARPEESLNLTTASMEEAVYSQSAFQDQDRGRDPNRAGAAFDRNFSIAYNAFRFTTVKPDNGSGRPRPLPTGRSVEFRPRGRST